ncbi:MAG: hypothetical protein ACRD1X_15985 [Vicinamibacteria bacterium]
MADSVSRPNSPLSLGAVSAVLLLLVQCLAACQTGTTAPSESPLSLPELKSLLLDELGEIFFCDPDYYPVAREDEAELARERFPELAADPVEFPVLLRRLGLEPKPTYTPREQLAVYREHKKLAAILTEPMTGGYRWEMRVTAGDQVEALAGEIDLYGRIRVTSRRPSFDTCPICLAEGTLIDTPLGQIPVRAIRVGTIVWSVDESGARVAVQAEKVGQAPAPNGHAMIRLVLKDGRILLASPGHPLTDGRPLEALRAGATVDGSEVLLVEHVAYPGTFVFDLLPASATGWYWADGVLLGSTLRR